MMAVYLGVVNEEDINNMSIPFFNNVLGALGKRVNYDAIVNYAGNSFAKDSWEMIKEANPLTKPRKVSKGFMEMLNKVPTMNKKEQEDISWAMEEPVKE